MTRRSNVAGATALIVIAAFAVGPMTLMSGQAAPRGAVCSLSGSASISPGLGATAKFQTVTFNPVTLSKCLMGNAGAPGVPKFTGGTAFISTVSGTASCATGSLNGISATINWNDGSSTTATFSTKSVTGETAITGKITGGSNPNLSAGNLLEGDAVFKPAKTSMNCAKVPVTGVTFTGAIAAGAPK